MKKYNFIKGRNGESEALNFLSKKGYTFFDKNYKCKVGEIDLIFKDKEELVFVEVKTKANDVFGQPEEMITPFKIRQIYKVAQFYLNKNSLLANRFQKYRIDAVCIVMENNTITRINHYENIYCS